MLAPSAAALSAIARPIPREAPVIKRVLPFNDIGVRSPSLILLAPLERQ